MQTVYCVFKSLDEGADTLMWICATLQKAQELIERYGKYNGHCYIREEIVEE